MNNDILIIYPRDETTNFLNAIPEYLFYKIGKERFLYQRIGFNKKEHQDCINLIKKLRDNSTIIFLGHGRSDALFGAMESERFAFISKNDLGIFIKKRVFFLSCRSSELLENQNIDGIGFGHLLSSPTELNDVNIRRQFSFIYSTDGIPDSKTIYRFNELLVEIVGASLNDQIHLNLSLKDLYLNLKLRLNKAITHLILNNDTALVQSLANLLFKAKREMKLFEYS